MLFEPALHLDEKRLYFPHLFIKVKVSTVEKGNEEVKLTSDVHNRPPY